MRHVNQVEGREEQTRFCIGGGLNSRVLFDGDVEIFGQIGRSDQAKEVKLGPSPSLQACWVENGVGSHQKFNISRVTGF